LRVSTLAYIYTGNSHIYIFTTPEGGTFDVGALVEEVELLRLMLLVPWHATGFNRWCGEPVFDSLTLGPLQGAHSTSVAHG